MKLQFSLATLLICVTVLAVVCAECVKVPVTEGPYPARFGTVFIEDFSISRPPTVAEIAWRLALWGPASIVVTLGVLWIVRRFRTRPVQ